MRCSASPRAGFTRVRFCGLYTRFTERGGGASGRVSYLCGTVRQRRVLLEGLGKDSLSRTVRTCARFYSGGGCRGGLSACGCTTLDSLFVTDVKLLVCVGGGEGRTCRVITLRRRVRALRKLGGVGSRTGVFVLHSFRMTGRVTVLECARGRRDTGFVGRLGEFGVARGGSLLAAR